MAEPEGLRRGVRGLQANRLIRCRWTAGARQRCDTVRVPARPAAAVRARGPSVPKTPLGPRSSAQPLPRPNALPAPVHPIASRVGSYLKGSKMLPDVNRGSVRLLDYRQTPDVPRGLPHLKRIEHGVAHRELEPHDLLTKRRQIVC